MSTNKNIDKICIAIIILVLIITVLFMNGEKFGMKAIVDDNSENYTGTEYFTANDQDGTWDDSQATFITLEETDATINGNGAYVSDGNVVISNGGRYVVTGTLTDGNIIVNSDNSSKIWIRLKGVNINCSDDACLRIDQADKVFLTLADGTENTFTSGATYSSEALDDNTGGVIFSHDDLTINGSGSLDITANYKHGIDANDDLVITGGTIKITAPADAIHINDNFCFMTANLTIDAEDDAIHADKNIYVESGTILVNTCYEGFESLTIDIAGGDITIYPADDGMNANGNSESQIGAGMGGGPGNMPENPFGDETKNSAENGTGTSTENVSKSASEKETAAENRTETAADNKTDTSTENVSKSASEKETAAENRTETVADNKTDTSTENVSKSDTEKVSGTDSKNASGTDTEKESRPNAENSTRPDFGIENNTSEEAKEETYIRITGGTITIINESARDADGLDSNGDIFIDGGTIRISLLGEGMNNAIDYGSESGGECIITGGNIIACGGSSMVEELSSNSTQCAVLYNLEETAEAGTTFLVTDANGNEILNYTPPCSYSSVAFSCQDLEQGAAYKVVTGGNSEEVTLENTSTTVGETSGFGSMNPGSGGPPSGGPSAGFSFPENSEDAQNSPNMQQQSGDNSEESSEQQSRDNSEESSEQQSRDNSEDSSGEQSPDNSGNSSVNNETTQESPQTKEAPKDPAQIEETSEEESSMPDKKTWLLLGASFLVLAGGIIIAIKFGKD